jgi:two-component system, chemotaxis family, chemotaxis protein CheY
MDPGNTATQNRPVNILIVDDSAMMRAMIKRVLGITDVPVGAIYEAGNGAEALQVLEGHAVDVLFTDINMPVMNGTELLRTVAADQRWRDVRRVIISTDGSASRRGEAAHLDVRCYLEKPITPEVIRDVLTAVADGDVRA